MFSLTESQTTLQSCWKITAPWVKLQSYIFLFWIQEPTYQRSLVCRRSRHSRLVVGVSTRVNWIAKNQFSRECINITYSLTSYTTYVPSFMYISLNFCTYSIYISSDAIPAGVIIAHMLPWERASVVTYGHLKVCRGWVERAGVAVRTLWKRSVQYISGLYRVFVATGRCDCERGTSGTTSRITPSSVHARHPVPDW